MPEIDSPDKSAAEKISARTFEAASVKKPRWRRVLGCVVLAALAVVLLGAVGFGVYVSDYYHASDSAFAALDNDETVSVVELADKGIAFKAADASTAIVFYPGGKVQAEAYAPLCRAIAERGVTCVLEPMPFNLAVFDINAANGAIANFPDISSWYVAGHSLGGSMAAQYAASHPGLLDGLVLLGSYSASNVSASSLRVLSIYGSNDGVLNRQKYADSWKNLPASASELVIEGGNHAQFGDYGEQKGDGAASILAAEQRTKAADAIAAFVTQ